MHRLTKSFFEEKEVERLLQQSLEKITADFRCKQSTGLTIETLKNFHIYLDKIKGDLILQKERVQLASEYKDQCLRILEEAVKKRKLVEKLKEKQWLEYQDELLREDQKFLDELGIQAYMKDR